MKIYDAFTFYNETDLLLVRMREHAPFVDHFILVEGDHTHAGKPKSGVFDIEDPRFTEFRSKIIHVEAKLQPAPCDALENERRQRNAILEAVSPAPDDMVLIGDVDEIVSRLAWEEALHRARSLGGVALRMVTAYYYVNLLLPVDCTASKLYRYRDLSAAHRSADDTRWGPAPASFPRVFDRSPSCGWHFSYIGTASFIQQKLESFSHQEYNKAEFKDLERIEAAIAERRDPWGRYTNFTAVPVDDSWPLEITNNPFWKRFTLPADPLPRRLWARGQWRVGLLASAIAERGRSLLGKAH